MTPRAAGVTLAQARGIALAQPQAIEKLFWGQRAVGLKIVLRKATPGMLKALICSAWASKAPTKLLGPAKRKDN
jgi:hypothetical protein